MVVAPAADAANDVGWVLADQPSNPNMYTPSPQHSFNSQHSDIIVARGQTGVYTVYFSNLYIPSAPRNTQVSAYNSANRCWSNGSIPSGTTIAIGVECIDTQGLLADTEFTLLFQTRSAPFALGSARDAIAFLDQTPQQSYNSQGGRNKVVASSQTGNYTVTLAGLTRQGGNVQVSTLNSSPSTSCKTVSWAADSSGTTVTVRCYRIDNGYAHSGPFSLAYAIGEPFGLVPGEGTLGAWLWANDYTSTASYRPNERFQYNGFKTGAMSSQKTSTGHYTVTIPGTLTYSSSIALVTAYGAGKDYCSVAGWTTNQINVVCYDYTGAFADSRFNVTFQTAR